MSVTRESSPPNPLSLRERGNEPCPSSPLSRIERGTGGEDPGERGYPIDRREAIRRVSALLGGVVLIGGGGLVTACEQAQRRAAAARGGAGAGTFTARDIAFLDEVAETILPETKTPGAKAAQVGPFMALMVTDTYDEREQAIFRDGMRKLDAACQTMHRTSFMEA